MEPIPVVVPGSPRGKRREGLWESLFPFLVEPCDAPNRFVRFS